SDAGAGRALRSRSTPSGTLHVPQPHRGARVATALGQRCSAAALALQPALLRIPVVAGLRARARADPRLDRAPPARARARGLGALSDVAAALVVVWLAVRERARAGRARRRAARAGVAVDLAAGRVALPAPRDPSARQPSARE